MQRQKIELEVGSECPCMFSRQWSDTKYIWHTPDQTHRQTQSPGLRGNERSAILDFFPVNKEEAAIEAEVMGFVRVDSYFICMLLRVGTLVRWGFCIYKQKFQEPWRSWSVSKCPFRQAEWEALANRFGCHMHKEVNPSGRDTAPSYCVCTDVTVSSQDQRPVRVSEAEPQAGQWLK